ncbi:serine/threonine protein kinase [Nocardia caishijiensis]|uniref:Serine/threonine protein kinase n=2 Tax=Nocardia caishijiensis TaxID=184756 RepID=A0ABQ6YV04_9NOCA|nr:serine/threonine protein kinase [Nocardia caishijiensis]
MQPLSPRDPIRLGRYRLLSVLGRGGMGQVLLGQAPDGRLVAVKQIHQQFTGSPEFRARFRREVSASQQVTGAYTAGVLDHDADSETPWLASEYIAGPALQDMIIEFGPLPVSGLKLLTTGLAMALLEIHRTGLVHRDLTPSNVLLTNEGPRVIDFGIARAVEDDATLTATGAVIGSPAYMSPEQAECQPLTTASDVFAVGAILAMAATGSSPFAAVATPQVLYNVLYSTPDTTGVPAPVRPLVDACLAKNPAERPTPEQLLDAADRIEAEPVWPVRIRRRIAECQTEAAAWANGTASAAPVETSDPDRKLVRLALAAGVVAALVLGCIALVGIGRDGTAIAMDDPPLALTDDETRRLDICALLTPQVIGELGTQVGDSEAYLSSDCRTDYRDATGRTVGISLETGVPPDDSDQPLGPTINWMPVLGRYRQAALCQRSVRTQSGLPMVLSVSATLPGGDGCPVAERALAAIVRRLSVNPPLRDYEANSILLLDPCAFFDVTAVRSAVGDPVRSRTPHGCALTGRDGYFSLDFTEWIRPDDVRSGKVRPTRTIADRTVHVERNDADACEFQVMTKPISDERAEQIQARFVRRVSAPTVACAVATTLLEPILEQLPPS